MGHTSRECSQNEENTDRDDSGNRENYRRVRIQETTSIVEVQDKNSEIKQLIGMAKINDKSIRFLLDTDSSRSLLNTNVLDKDQTKSIKPYNSKISTANGQSAKIIGVYKCKFQLSTQVIDVEFLVVEDLIKQCIVGMDILSRIPYTNQLVKAFQVICKDSERYTDRKMSQKEAKKYDYEIRKMIRRATFQEKNHRYFAETPDDDVHEEQTAIMQETKESQIKDLEISEEELGILAIDVRDIEKNVISDDELAEAVKKEITSIAANGFNTLTPTRTIAHEIKVETGAKPVTHAPRKTPFALKKDFKQVIEEMEEAKLIRPSKSN